MPAIRIRYAPVDDPNAAVKTGGGTIHALKDKTETLCGRDTEEYKLGEADPLDPEHSDFCKTCAGKLQKQQD